MKKLVSLEEVAQMGLGFYFLNTFGYSYWALFGLFFLPDLSMLGYLVNTKIGAYLYNFFHHKGIALAAVALGSLYGLSELSFSGWILFTHSCFDRVLGYGLKHEDSFQHTHLGWIGKK